MSGSCPPEGSRGNAPIVEDLGAHDVPAHAPRQLVAFVPQPIVAEDLCVEVVRLETRVVDVERGSAAEEEEAVMVHQFVAPVEAAERVEYLAGLVVDELAREEELKCVV
jgi:hypothetical protein